MLIYLFIFFTDNGTQNHVTDHLVGCVRRASLRRIPAVRKYILYTCAMYIFNLYNIYIYTSYIIIDRLDVIKTIRLSKKKKSIF